MDFQRLQMEDPHLQSYPETKGVSQSPRFVPASKRQSTYDARGSAAQKHDTLHNQSSPLYTFPQHPQFSPYSGFQGTAFAPGNQDQKQPEDRFDEEAFEKAFNEAAEAQMKSLGHEQNQASSTSQDNIPAQDIRVNPEIERIRIGSDQILDEAQLLEREDNADDEAEKLAKTAGQLLENLSHDQSQKFQGSSFLSLMRQLRDREVEVEGDKLVDVSIP